MQRRGQHRVQRSKQGGRKGAAAAAAAARRRVLKASQVEAKRLAGQVVVNVANLRHTNSYGTPDFVARGYYVDFPFKCKDCGKSEVWSPTQQRWWYEIAKGDVWTVANRCRPCRQRERARRNGAREVAESGIAKKRGVKPNISLERTRER
jgi:Probable zinc-ribbon domain